VSTALANGPYDVQVTATDKAGNVVSDTITKDLVVGAVAGPVAFLELPAQNASTGPLWYNLQAIRGGLLTVDAIATGLPASASLTLYDANLNRLSTSTMFGGNQRITRTTAAAGENYFVKLTGTATSVKLRITNLVVPSGATVIVYGTSGADAFTYTPASNQITINAATYVFTSAVTSYTFAGAGGADTAIFNDSASADALTATPTYTILSRGGSDTKHTAATDYALTITGPWSSL
jgi:hypothetical protein